MGLRFGASTLSQIRAARAQPGNPSLHVAHPAAGGDGGAQVPQEDDAATDRHRARAAAQDDPPRAQPAHDLDEEVRILVETGERGGRDCRWMVEEAGRGNKGPGVITLPDPRRQPQQWRQCRPCGAEPQQFAGECEQQYRVSAGSPGTSEGARPRLRIQHAPERTPGPRSNGRNLNRLPAASSVRRTSVASAS